MSQRIVNARNRRTKRLPIHWPTVLVSGDSRQACTIVDVSRGGAKVRVVAPVTPGTHITLLDERVGTIEATVKWRRGDMAGVAFSEPSPEVAERLRDLIIALEEAEARRRVHPGGFGRRTSPQR